MRRSGFNQIAFLSSAFFLLKKIFQKYHQSVKQFESTLAGILLPISLSRENVSYEREAGRIDLYGPQEMATQARQASRDTTCVSPSPAGPAGCCPLNFLYLINLKF